MFLNQLTWWLWCGLLLNLVLRYLKTHFFLESTWDFTSICIPFPNMWSKTQAAEASWKSNFRSNIWFLKMGWQRTAYVKPSKPKSFLILYTDNSNKMLIRLVIMALITFSMTNGSTERIGHDSSLHLKEYITIGFFSLCSDDGQNKT